MKLFRYLTPGLFGALLPAMSTAADVPRHAFECDTPAGHFSYWKRSVSAAQIEVEGKVTVNDMLKDKKWSPGASIVFSGGQTRYGLRFYGVMKTPEFLFLELLQVGGRESLGLEGIIPRTKDPISFKLLLAADGTLKVTVAGSEAQASLGSFKPESIELSCSTGDFEFTDVTVNEK